MVKEACQVVGISLRWEGTSKDEVGIVESCDPDKLVPVGSGHPLVPNPKPLFLAPGQIIVRIDPRYYRPTEVETLLGDPSKAHRQLGWTPKTTFSQLVEEMVLSDLEEAKRDELCRRHGYSTFDYHE
jgi:GDPmannose 4,6-dehydratase